MDLRKISPATFAFWILILAVLYYIFVFSLLSILNQNVFGTGTHDVGIYDQIIWQLSNFKSPYTTLGGASLFAFHVSGNCLLLAPLFWIWSNINMLYIAQSVFLAGAVFPLFFYARRKLASSFLALAVSLSFLLYPALQNMNLENFHPEAITIFFLTWAVYFMLVNRFSWYYPFYLLSLVGKEEMGLVGVFLGIYMMVFRKQKKHGSITALTGLLWFLLCMRAIMPLANGISVFAAAKPVVYSHWFGGFANNILNPAFYWSNIYNMESITYLRNLLEPLFYLPLLSPAVLLIAVPQIAINMLSGCYYLRSIFFHYNYVVTAVLYFAFINSLAIVERFRSNVGQFKRIFVILVGIAILSQAVIYNNLLSRLPIGRHWRIIRDTLVSAGSPDMVTKREALKLIPPGANVSASYSLFPHLSHRDEIYMFSNPFKDAYWTPGVPKPPALKHVDYLAIEWGNHGSLGEQLILRYLMGSPYYKEIYSEGGVMILQRKAFEPPANAGANYVLYPGKKGVLSTIYFPFSHDEFRNLLGEAIEKKDKMELDIFGYLLIPESGQYGFTIKSCAEVSLTIDGRPVHAPVYLAKGPHPYRIEYLKKERGDYDLAITVIPPSGRECIIPDDYLWLRPDAPRFQTLLGQYKREKNRREEFIRRQKNGVVNGGFELVSAGRPQNWQITCWQAAKVLCSYEVDRVAKKAGEYSAKIVHRGLADSRWVQKVPVKPSARYRLSGWIKTTDIPKSGGGAYLEMTELGSRSEVLFGTQGWRYFEIEGKTKRDQKEITVLCRLGDYGAPNEGAAYFDEIVLKELPKK